jgi:hypothetical protein
MIALYLSVSGATMLPNSNSTILFAEGPIIQENEKLLVAPFFIIVETF